MNAEKSYTKFTHDLVLVGGGHSHALMLLQWAMNPMPGVRVTLVSENSDSPYSGMLPGLVAGHYERDDVHIDLRNLCRHGGVRFIQAKVEKIDPATQRIHLQDRPALEYDTLSINVGSTPDLSVPGAAQYAIPVKPIAHFWQQWLSHRERLLLTDQVEDIAVVGGGAGSVELILAMANRLRTARVNHRFHLISRGATLLPGYPSLMIGWLQRRLDAYQIKVHLNADVVQVLNTQLKTATNESIPATTTFWCTQARAAGWLAQSDLDVTAAGFVRVQPTLQTLRWPNIFAAGDCAWLDIAPSPRAGVYAVRQAPVLADNLKRLIRNEALRTYRPQKHFLSLLATGDKDAVGARGMWPMAGTWVWRWKDRIDRRFMAMLQQLPVLPPPEQTDSDSLEPPAMRCGGCGGKVGADVLHQALMTSDSTDAGDHCVIPDRDDAAVIPLPGEQTGQVLVQSVDALKPLLDDPYLTGRITTLHALSDLYAMNAQPHSAQIQVQIPVMAERLQVRDMRQLLAGVQQTLSEHGARLLGGHTLEAETLQLGLTVNGFADPATILRKCGAQVGDVLVLTKPLGTGALFAAAMRGAAKAAWIDQVLPSLLQSNAASAGILSTFHAHALTDITGFGLLGHLQEMLMASGVGARLELKKIPAFDGALSCIAAGYQSTLTPANRRLRHNIVLEGVTADDPRYALLFDPQTQGGLLAAIPAVDAGDCIRTLQSQQITACIIGDCVEGGTITVWQ